MTNITFNLNGRALSVTVPADMPFVDVLRDELGLTGAKVGCGEGECGTCTILLDDRPVCSCLLLAGQVAGKRVVTIEGLAGNDGEPGDLQRAFIEEGAVQCGFCTPGMIVAGEALLRRDGQVTRERLVEALAGNICRCTGYEKILQAIERVAKERQ